METSSKDLESPSYGSIEPIYFQMGSNDGHKYIKVGKIIHMSTALRALTRTQRRPSTVARIPTCTLKKTNLRLRIGDGA